MFAIAPVVRRLSAGCFLLALLLAGLPAARGQGVLVDGRDGHGFRLPRPWPPRGPSPRVPGASYKIESLDINATLSDTVAKVQVSQTFVNSGSGQIEASFVFPIPYDAAVDQLTLLIDGKEVAGKLLSAADARRRYEEIVRTCRDPALLEWVGSGMYQTSVFPIPPGGKRTVTLRYTQLCRNANGLTDFLFPLSTARYTSSLLEKLSVRVAVESSVDIKNIYSPSHAVTIERTDNRHAVVTLGAKNTAPADDFRLFYSTGRGSVGASVVSYRPDGKDEGYFLLLSSPQIDEADQERPAKTVIFCVDRSGSMSGQKMDQAKGALKFVLNNLRPGDLFNIVAYDSDVDSFRPELEKFSEQTRVAATAFINGLYAGGSTNIDGALARALGMAQDSSRPTYVMFLTDGLPTTGETSEAVIVKNSAAANKVRARIFAFGVGYDVNSRLLDKLARQNHGQTEYVRPDEDLEASVSSLYRRIGAPVLTDVAVTVDVDGAKTSEGPAACRIYPNGPFDLFAGDQIVLVGRYRASGAAKVTLRGKIGDKEQTFDFPAELSSKSDDDTNAFVAKLWATRRVGEIIDEIDLKGRNDELIKELVDLATKHGILTPYTSFLADDSGRATDAGTMLRGAAEQLGQLDALEGELAFRQRAAKGAYRMADRPESASAPALRGVGFGGGEGQTDAYSAPESLSSLAVTAGRGAMYYDAKADKEVVSNSVMAIGRKTFFRRNGQWVDSTLTDEEIKSAQRIERFSQAYFDLVEAHGQHVAAYLTIEEPVVIKLDGKVYAW